MTAARKFTATARRALLCSTAVALGLALGIASPDTATAQERTASYNIQGQSLGAALREFGRLSGVQIIFTEDLVRGRMAPTLRGDFSASDALDRLLVGSGLVAQRTPLGAVMIVREGENPQPEGDASVPGQATTVEQIVVTGSRIRGAPLSSPVISISAEDIRDRGYANLSEVARDLPQNFSGGQNPNLAFGAPGDGINVNSASSLNLRGLGPDATLTLLNGRRLSYSSVSQAIDISAIPAVAVSRLEIVADGSSALYGSDAVAGVANVILRRDFDGLAVRAGYGASTDGGNERHHYSLVGGQTWSSGGYMVALDYEQTTGIHAGDRDYTSNLHPTATLSPAMEATLAVLTGHQQITPRVRMEVDALYGTRRSRSAQPQQLADDYRLAGSLERPKLESFSISPRLVFDLSDRWSSTISFVYGEDKTTLRTLNWANFEIAGDYPGRYDNSLVVVEANAEGPLFRGPGGEVRLAAGAGYRRNSLDANLVFNFASGFSIVGVDFQESSDSYYGYAELYVPLIENGDDAAILTRAAVTGAVRWEDYGGAIGSIGTPKIGAVVDLAGGLSLKGSWGRSFKAPTLLQLFGFSTPYIRRADVLASTTYPADAHVLDLSGSNRALTPEEAETWTATLTYRPHWLPGGRFEVSYFHVDYIDRVVSPAVFSGILENRIYANYVVHGPTADQVLAAIALTDGVVNNTTGTSWRPEDIVAIVDTRLHNANRQTAKGVDVAAYYVTDIGDGVLTVAANASYLESEQRQEAGSDAFQLAGTVGRPPNWRGHAGVTWEAGTLTLNGGITYFGGVLDNRFPPFIDIGSMTTVDLTSRYRMPEDTILGPGVELMLTVRNIFNDQPPPMRTTVGYFPPYDSANYSAVGRYVGVSIEKRW